MINEFRSKTLDGIFIQILFHFISKLSCVGLGESYLLD